MNDKFVKVTYQSEPIGKENIVLYLTTFDLEEFKKNKALEKIPSKKEATMVTFDRYSLENSNFAEQMEIHLEHLFRQQYEKQLKDMAAYIEFLRNTAMPIVPRIYNKGEINDFTRDL